MSFAANFNNDREVVSGGVPGPEQQARINDHERATSDSDASTIAANLEGSPQTQRHHPDHKESYQTAQQTLATEDAQETARREEEVHQLARRLTSQSNYSAHHHNPFNAEPNSPLDPNGENFNARAWTKAMLNLQLEDANAGPTRTAGVSFRGLNVHGFGADTDYQKSVGNVWLEGPGLIKRLRGDKGRKIDILQNVEGLVEAGEMLVVLG
jgi:ATP-binding cassette subfamily G (WHITE) protein 2 (PDR)